MIAYRYAQCSVALVLALTFSSHVRAQARTAEGDILRGQGVFAAGAGWYNLRTAKANAINVQAMRNYNQEVRLNYALRVRYWTEKEEKRKLSKEEAAKRAEAKMKQIEENPTTEDIRAGHALNMLAVMLTDPDVDEKDWYSNAVKLPEGATLKDVVFQYYPNKMTEKDLKIDVALSRLSKNVDWPIAFSADAFSNERTAYENAVTKVRANVMKGKLEPTDMKALQTSLDELYSEIGRTYAQDKSGYSLKAKSFHGELKSATKLFDGDVVDYAQELIRETEEYDAKTVGELVAFMLKYRLFFSEADTPRSIELYNKLFSAMDQQAHKLGVKGERAGGRRKSREPEPAIDQDAYPAGTVLSGTGVFIGRDGKPLGEGAEWTMRIGRRDGDNFAGSIQHHKVNLAVGGTLPASGEGNISFRTRRGEESNMIFTGTFKRNGSLDLTFEGERDKKKFAGRVELKKK